MKNLYVGNLPFTTTEEDLRVEFSKHGTVASAQIVKDRDTGRSRGFGFVEMSDGADAAIKNEAIPLERVDQSTAGWFLLA